MAIWIIPVIIVGAIVVGLIIGLIVGKSQVKRSRPGYKPLLSRKEKLIYTALFVGGTALILLGAFYKFPSANAGTGEGEGENGIITFDQAPTEVAAKPRATPRLG